MPEILFFPYFGPNRRSDKRVLEMHLDFNADTGNEFPQKASEIRDRLIEAGALTNSQDFDVTVPLSNRRLWYSSLFAKTVLLLQQKSGHAVAFCDVFLRPDKHRAIALVEHEHTGVGLAAVKLATQVFSEKPMHIDEVFRHFNAYAREHVLPLETAALIRAARKRDIPVYQLDREPLLVSFKPFAKIRPNALIGLGHGTSMQMLDGSFCAGKLGSEATQLLNSPQLRMDLLFKLGFVQDNDGGERDKPANVHILVVNGQAVVIPKTAGGFGPAVTNAHESQVNIAIELSSRLGFAPVDVNVYTGDISLPKPEVDFHLLDFNLAPRLDDMLAASEDSAELLATAAEGLVRWLFPTLEGARMPSVAITGTNGKTTTTRMINHILGVSGHKPGMVCTQGIFLNGRQILSDDSGSFWGHARVLTSNQVDVAVLETHHRGISERGFAFEDCDVAVCLNVTEEHLEEKAIETVAEMAEIKRSLLERARHTAVLFADDEHCAAMPAFLDAETICLVSLKSSADELQNLKHKSRPCYCIIETVNDTDWIVFYEENVRSLMMPVAEIPATFGGDAKVNVSNAMHAMSASYLMGKDISVIRKAMSQFEAGQAMTPGRMTEVSGFPFRMFMDFAHNPDGMKKICEFVDRQEVDGRKLVAFSGLSRRTDRLNRLSAQALVGHFDYYFCKDFEPSKPPRTKYTAPFMQQTLIDAGIKKSRTEILTFGRDVIFHILDQCKPGDFLLLLTGHHESAVVPKYLAEYKAEKLK